LMISSQSLIQAVCHGSVLLSLNKFEVIVTTCQPDLLPSR
jgi:hypothetical protein